MRVRDLGVAVLWGTLVFGVVGGQCPQDEPLPGGATAMTWIPSEAAPGRGIVVRLIWPAQPRYPAGTVAVVEVPGRIPPEGWSFRGGPATPWWNRVWWWSPSPSPGEAGRRSAPAAPTTTGV